MKTLVTALLISLFCISSNAQKFIAIAKDTKVFETPIAKDEYAAQNSEGNEVILLPGMCFVIKEQKGGWYTIEYTQGLRGMVMQNIIADTSTFKKPVAGEYTVTNSQSKKVSVANNGKWTINTGSEVLEGTENSNIVIFLDKDGNQMYSLTNMNGKPLLYSYRNSDTKFY